MQTTNNLSTGKTERAGDKKQIIVIRHAAANGGVGCPVCERGELVRAIEPGTHQPVHVCLECGYTED